MRPIPTCKIMHKANFSWEYTVESVKRVKAPNPLRPKFRVLRPFTSKDKLPYGPAGKDV
jgi:hypothetical protein